MGLGPQGTPALPLGLAHCCYGQSGRETRDWTLEVTARVDLSMTSSWPPENVGVKGNLEFPTYPWWEVGMDRGHLVSSGLEFLRDGLGPHTRLMLLSVLWE